MYKVFDVIGYNGSLGRASGRTLNAALKKASGANNVERISITCTAPIQGECAVRGQFDCDGMTTGFTAILPLEEYIKYESMLKENRFGLYYSPPSAKRQP